MGRFFSQERANSRRLKTEKIFEQKDLEKAHLSYKKVRD